MEENKEIKKNKMPLYLIAIAIVLAVLGVMDLKVNATELLHYNYIKFGIDRGGNGSNHVMIDKEFSYTKPVYFYYWYTDPTARNMEIQFYMLSEEPIININDTSPINCNGKNYYCYSLYASSYGTATSSILLESNETTTTYIRKLNSKITGSEQDFISMHLNDTLDYERPPINYDELEVDDSIPQLEISSVNRIKNWVSSGLYNQYFDYIKWNGKSNYKVQVEKVFSVYFIRKVDGDYRTLGVEYNGDTIVNEILDFGANSLSQQTDLQYISDNRNDDFQFYSDIRKNTTIENWDKSEPAFCYRFRFIDEDNLKAGRWTVVVPYDDIGDYEQKFTISYELEDGTYSDTITSSGTNEEFKDIDELGGIGHAKDVIDEENKFKDKYDIIDGDADVGEITNWLNSVTGFIKSSPSVIGSVLSFLPQPILYGLYITIFLGVFATAIGIVKALI